MGWEEDYDDSFSDEDLENTVEYIQKSLINVDPSLVAEAVSQILSEFQKTFGYTLKLELETKTYQDSRGYIAAHFTPKKYNKREMYFTLIHFPQFKQSKTARRYILDFADGFYNDDGTENDHGIVTTLIRANNFLTISEALVKQWKKFE